MTEPSLLPACSNQLKPLTCCLWITTHHLPYMFLVSCRAFNATLLSNILYTFSLQFHVWSYGYVSSAVHKENDDGVVVEVVSGRAALLVVVRDLNVVADTPRV